MVAELYARRPRRVGEPGSRGSTPRHDGGLQVAEIQRSRLLAAAVGAVDELGYPGMSVASITERARVSRRTFYDLFENREECVAAVLDGAVEQLAEELAAAALQGSSWRERIRGGLWVILSFLDREPALARVCIVQSQRGGPLVLERRQEILDLLASVIDEGRRVGPRGQDSSDLTAEGLVGAVLAILQGRLLDPGPQALRDLHGELTAMIVLPYLGASAARRERSRHSPVPLQPVEGEKPLTSPLGSVEPLAGIPMRLTHRTALVLEDLAEHPGSSNREVADRVDVHDQGQMSKLLGRLVRFGLITNGAQGAPAKGEPNHWKLTPTGTALTRSIRAHTGKAGQSSLTNGGDSPSQSEEGMYR
jgi:AcrR family transcriptional regulator/DNA-binding MarR family transcriptional regulator